MVRLVIVNIAIVPAEPEVGVKLTPSQPLPDQPAAFTATGTKATARSRDQTIQSASLIIRLYDFLGILSNLEILAGVIK